MTSALSIAAAQTIPIRGDIGANMHQHTRLVRTAADAGARVVVFPELSLTGYELDLAQELAFAERDARLAPLCDLASSHRLTVVAGAPVRIGARLHIGAFIVGPDGVVDVYTKHHLGAFATSVSPDGIVPPAEATVFEPGDRNPVVDVGDATAAIAVCADINRPSHPEQAASRGARIYLASMFVIPAGLESDTAKLRSYAARHGMTVLLANFGGPTGGLPAAGSSAAWSDGGEMLARLPDKGSGIVVATKHDGVWRAETFMVDD